MAITQRSLMLAVTVAAWTGRAQPGGAEVHDLTIPENLLANCTTKYDGTYGFGPAETSAEMLSAKHGVLMAQTRCMTFIHAVYAATTYSGVVDICLPTVSLGDLRAAVLLTLKQKHKTTESSVPIIVEALQKNWPCH